MPRRADTPSAKAEPSTGSSRKSHRESHKRASIEAEIAAADKQVAKRRAQLEAAIGERAALVAKLARLELADDGKGPMAYCLKERLQVRIGGAHAVVLANGRPAIAGACPSCGSKLVRIGAG